VKPRSEYRDVAVEVGPRRFASRLRVSFGLRRRGRLARRCVRQDFLSRQRVQLFDFDKIEAELARRVDPLLRRLLFGRELRPERIGKAENADMNVGRKVVALLRKRSRFSRRALFVQPCACASARAASAAARASSAVFASSSRFVRSASFAL
jgi:hypothetical protein